MRATLGLMRFAYDAGCRPRQVRELVAGVVRAAVGDASPDATRAAVDRGVGIVDIVFLLYGTEGPATHPDRVADDLVPLLR